MNTRFLFLCLTFLVCICTCVHAQTNFYEQTSIREVRLTFQDGNWSKKLKALKEREPNRRIIGSVTIDGVRFDSVGVRYKGNSSYNNPSKKEQRKLPINIKLDFVKKEQTLPGGVGTLKLSNAFRDPSFVREPLAYEIARQYMPAPGSNFVKLYINDEYMGLYNNTESIDDRFLMKHFGQKGKGLFKCDPDDWQAIVQKPNCKLSKEASLASLGAGVDCYKELYELSGDPKYYGALLKLINTLDKNPESVHEILDVDQVLWMLAFNNVFVNLDSYNGYLSHNYYLFLDSLEQFRPLLWDMNLCFGGFRYDGKANLTNKELIEYPALAEKENPNRPLISKLLVSDYNRKLYYHHMRTILEDWVESKRYFTSATQMQSQIDKSVLEDKQKLYTYEAFKENLKTTSDVGKLESIGISELMEGRVFFLKGLTELRAPAPQMKKQEKIIAADSVTFRVQAKDAERVVLMYRAHAGELFKAKHMKDPFVPQPVEAGNLHMQITMPTKIAKQYYFILEGDQSIATFPARASFEYLKL